MAEPAHSEPTYANPAQTQSKLPWYRPNIDDRLVPETRELLEKYSHVPPSEQSRHVHEIRDRLWAIRTYPCTGLGVWLVPQLRMNPGYAEMVQRVQRGGLLMDVGCFVGYDLRRLVYDGAPSEQLYGIDIADHWQVGFDMFRDRDAFRAHFVAADLLALAAALPDLHGRFSVICVSQVLQQWDWDTQVAAAKQLVALATPDAIVAGNSIANPNDGVVVLPATKTPAYRQSPASFARLWDQVGAETGTKWATQAALKTFVEMGWSDEDRAWMEPGLQMMEFVVRRVG